MKTYRARLIEDRGRAVLSNEFFRSQAHFDAEGVTHTLLVEGAPGSLRIPLVVRPIPGTGLADASSPYGHPGGDRDTARSIPPDDVDFSAVPLVSIFVRDRIGEDTCFAGGTLRARSLVADQALPDRLRDHTKDAILRNLKAGFRNHRFKGTEAPAHLRAEFRAAYAETMVRTRAAPRYFFSDAWFERVFRAPTTHFVITCAPSGELAAGNIAVASDGFLHGYLGGTCDVWLRSSPFKNTVLDTIALGQSLGLSFNFGAGLRPGDGLEVFKRAFSNAEQPFYTHHIVCDARAYAALSAGRPEGAFFPQYRAPHGQATPAGAPAMDMAT